MEKVTIGRATLYCGDALEVLPGLRRKIDAVVTDPPYHLTTIGRSQPNYINRGFMGQTWDGGDIAFRPETWAVIGDALGPGGFMLAFGGTRTAHRMACAIEDSGFVVQDTIAWIYGSGFPKNRTLLKPAFEPICLAYKPGGKRTMQIDECRIGTDGGTRGSNYAKTGLFGVGGKCDIEDIGAGRWPANVCHDGSEEVLEAFARFGDAGGGTDGGKRLVYGIGGNGILHGGGKGALVQSYADTGTAACFFYCAKANKADRAGSKHPTVKPQALMRWLIPLVTPRGGTVLDPFGGSGSTAQAALATGRRVILIEREPRWFDDACARLENMQTRRAA